MNKSAADRWTEMINYLNAAFPAAAGSLIGNHINSIIPVGQRDAISKELSLGSTSGVHKSTKVNKPARNALRALLLCQRVYFSDKWAKASFVGDETAPANYLPPNWKAQSLTYWGMKSESAIKSGIGMFATVSGATAEMVSDVAQDDPPNGGMPSGTSPQIAGNLTYSRTHFPLTGPRETCYRGVLAWLFKAGVVSYRWFMKNPAPTGAAALGELFGDGEDVWPRGTPFTNTSVIPDVPKGYVLHMWAEESGVGGWNGHWVISNGDGTICGVNNGEILSKGVQKQYTKTGTLWDQFEGYAQLQKRDDKTKFVTATCRLVKFDPMNLPGRM